MEGFGMEKKMILDYIRLFREKANTDKLIVFVGAGVSRNVEGMPSWLKLIQEMAKSIDYSKCADCRHKQPDCEQNCKFMDDYSQDEYLKIPQYVFNADPVLYKGIIQENISDIEIDAPLSQAIFGVNPAHIITTNYDKLIESSSDARRENYDVIIKDKDLLVSRKNKYIIKMHGDIGFPDTIILKEDDYLQYSQKHVLIEMFVKALLSDHTILFLGYSLNDYNIKLIISWINFIRSQNDALEFGTKIGYIALDQDEIASTEISYFENNNIGVINLRGMPLQDEMPASITNDVGKRLYSFLSTISIPSLERKFGIIELYDDVVEFLLQFKYVTCDCICENLHLGRKTSDGQSLALHKDECFDSLVEYLNLNTTLSNELKKLFINAGIKIILLISLDEGSMRSDEYRLENSENSLLNSSLYQLYLKNEYNVLISACEALPAQEWRDSCFFYSLAHNYMGPIFERYNDVDFSCLTLEEKCAYLFNIDSLEIQRTWKHNSQKLKQFIKGIPDQKNRGALSQYTEVYEGNAKRLLKLQQSLSKLKEQYEGNHTFVGCCSLDELYKIKRSAMEVYQFYFANRLFHIRFSELKTIMRVYAESIVCTNGEHESPRKSIWGEASAKAKYSMTMIDFDVVTKFLSIKELNGLLATYNIKEINVDNSMKDHAVSCFKNISSSIIKATLYNRFLSAPSILINCMQLLCYLDLRKRQN